MATADSVKAKMQGLIDSTNAKTGGSDTNLTAAVNTLIAGYGASGGASGIYMAKVTPAEDTDALVITHNLGTSDILLACCWAETLGDTVPTFACALGKAWAKTDVGNSRGGVGYNAYAAWNITNSYANISQPSSAAYWDGVEDENNFKFKQAGGAVSKYITGVTYTVVIVAASALPGV